MESRPRMKAVFSAIVLIVAACTPAASTAPSTGTGATTPPAATTAPGGPTTGPAEPTAAPELGLPTVPTGYTELDQALGEHPLGGLSGDVRSSGLHLGGSLHFGRSDLALGDLLLQGDVQIKQLKSLIALFAVKLTENDGLFLR